MDMQSKIYVAGHHGLVGSNITKLLTQKGYKNILTRTKSSCDLTNQHAVHSLFEEEKPEYVILAAAKVGGIHANNTYRGDFIYQNLAIQNNIVESARHYHVKRLLFLGSSCIYPRNCPQPMKEEFLLKGELESTNEPYAIAKIAGIKLCDSYNYQYGTDFISVMPTNLYGPGDNFDLNNSHVLPAILRKAHEAKMKGTKKLVIWGTGAPLREFLHVEDMAEACLFVMQNNKTKEMLNIGSGHEVSIKQLAEIICEVVGFDGELEFDSSKPDGTPRKLVDTTKINQLGWKARIDLKDGIRSTYEWFKSSVA